MNRLAKLRNDRAAIVARMEALLDAADKAGREFSADEQKDYDEHVATLASLDGRIKREEAFLEARGAEATVIRSLAGDGTSPAADETANGRSAVGRVHDNSQDDPTRGFKSHKDFLLCVMAAGQGRRPDSRLRPLEVSASAGTDEQQTQSEQYGGYLSPEAFLPEFMVIDPEADPTGATTKVPMQTPVVKLPARTDKNHTQSVTGGLQWNRREETGAVVSSLMQMEQIRMEAMSLFGLSFSSEEVLVDSPISFIAILEQGFSQELTAHMVNEKLNGTGVGQFLGIMNSPALIAVAKTTSQATATINIQNVLQMRSQSWHYDRSIWLANHDTLPQIAQLALTGSGNASVVLVFMPSSREGVPETLLGRPIVFTEYCQTLGSQGDLVLADWSQFLEGTYQPMQSASSVHVRFVNHERCFKFWLRNAGAPWWRTPLTPKFSTYSLSPFVTLQARP